MLDSTDQQILQLLQQNAKLTIKELAEMLNLTTSPVFERIKRLEKDGVISGYVALVNPE
ncbi:Lrp/AsnC family transcriptional regulator, partial [Flectobacillus sp. BAB-3569]